MLSSTIVALPACGGDDGEDGDLIHTTSAESSGGSSSSQGTTEGNDSTSTTDADTTSATTTTATTADTSTSEGSGTTGDTEGDAAVYAVVVRGTLAGDDLEASKAAHDAIAMMGERPAMAAGDFAHDVLLGTDLLDSVPNEFLAVDRWDDVDAMQAFYMDPTFQQAFGSLFAAPPTLEFFELAPQWVNWGTMESGEELDQYYWHFALGTLASEDEETNHAAHDAVASGGKEPSMMAGNLAHVVFLGLEDRRRFLAVDIWGNSEIIEPFYTDPMFVMFFAPLFESVTQPVYVSTDWYQW
ncbi:MAG: hypothetical protein K1X88_04830 [Nannocystaceae bacterium]|nr:hypothetical protein [Nannocystaceae bacterium]